MSIESEPSSDSAVGNAEALARDFGEAIVDLPEYQRFLETKEAVEADEEAQAEIQEFEQIREEFMMARQTGQATEEGLRELQTAQEQLHDIPVMDAFLEAQNELELRLQALNETISAPLALDFGEKAGGCCND
jgi:cell fate (sporulation/competence/biofilm development) regulator YlbF (YheA/YmcA/DUF963 family)